MSRISDEMANRSLIFLSILVTLQLDDKLKISSSSQTFVKRGGQVCKKRDRKRQVLPEHPVSSQQSSPTLPQVVIRIMPPTFNDFSARDIQLQEMMGLLGPAKGKLENKSGKHGYWRMINHDKPGHCAPATSQPTYLSANV